MAELSVYLHIPFCERKCPYCAFISYARGNGAKDLYLGRLADELAFWRSKLGGISARTLYIGGGTPSCLSLSQWETLSEIIERNMDLSACTEFTVEANPNSLTKDLLSFWKSAGVSRVSLGVQSLDDEELQFLGRLHDSKRALEAVENAVEAGFSVNADFMFGIPGQMLSKWKSTLETAVKLGLSHVSLYQLTIEEGTPFASRGFELPEGYGQYLFAQEYLPERGYVQYEVANFALSGKESRHNLNYWRGGDYLGAGISASGYLDGVRCTNESGFEEYCALVAEKGNAVVFREKLEPDAGAREASVLQLRMTEGIDRAKYRAKYGEAAEKYVLSVLENFPCELYSVTPERIALTQAGMRVANRIWTELV
ncbi:MAG: radical SAM family heme chaperone HemW [Synergistaceae bacterium]|nr:radical SAM family heme chaperone HemW [Candidatus Equadaptatus faecalis]